MPMRSAVLSTLSALTLAILPGSALASQAPGPRPPNVIFDTDIWGDIDDMLALAMLHSLHDRGEINLVAVTISMDDKWCAPYVDLVNTFYGHPDIPIGVAKNGVTLDSFRRLYPKENWPVTRYTEIVSNLRTKAGAFTFPHRLLDGARAQEAVGLLRRTLARQPDGSVVVVMVGYSTNLARLLDSKPDAASPLGGGELVRKKVRLLSVMAGNFGEWKEGGRVIQKGTPEFNLVSDVPAAQKVFAEWPTPLVASGFEIGLALLYPAASIEHDYSYVAAHPIATTYRTYAEETKAGWPHDHPSFDLTSVLYAARPDRDYFTLSPAGKITVLADGGSRFEESPNGTHRYLLIDEGRRARTLEALVMLASQPPIARRH
jgi:inosine-uridine nucleoside N-ribohydrolase